MKNELEILIDRQRRARLRAEKILFADVTDIYKELESLTKIAFERIRRTLENLFGAGKLNLRNVVSNLTVKNSIAEIVRAQTQAAIKSFRAIESAQTDSHKTGNDQANKLLNFFGQKKEKSKAKKPKSETERLKNLFADFPETTRSNLQDALISGIGTNQTPSEIAKALRNITSINLSRALTIARTETNRAYRAATLEAYKDVGVEKFRWTASKIRSCPSCLALDGKIFPLEKKFLRFHLNCRCFLTPKFDNGIDDFENGQMWLDSQTETKKREILGAKAFDEYIAGNVTLDSFISENQSDVYGITYTTASLKQALQNPKRFKI